MLSMFPDLIHTPLSYLYIPPLVILSFVWFAIWKQFADDYFYWFFLCLHSKLCTLWYRVRMIVCFVGFNSMVFQLRTPLSFSLIHIEIYFFARATLTRVSLLWLSRAEWVENQLFITYLRLKHLQDFIAPATVNLWLFLVRMASYLPAFVANRRDIIFIIQFTTAWCTVPNALELSPNVSVFILLTLLGFILFSINLMNLFEFCSEAGVYGNSIMLTEENKSNLSRFVFFASLPKMKC